MKRLLLSSVLALAFGSMASAITIADINALQCKCLTIGDKLFQGISVDGALASSVNVTGSQVGDTVFINFGGPFFTTNSVFPGTDFQIFYDVTALGGVINSIDQSFNLSATGTGGVVSIGESVFSDPGRSNLVARSSVGFAVGADDPSDPAPEPAQGDQLNINPPLTRVWVSKDILLLANGALGSGVGATIITQSFHQVPEPVHAAFLLGGCLLIGRYYKSRKLAQA